MLRMLGRLPRSGLRLAPLVVLVVLVLTSSAIAASRPTRGLSVTGSYENTAGVHVVRIDAHSGPRGQDPMGRIFYGIETTTGGDSHAWLMVTSLNVTGTTATIGYKGCYQNAPDPGPGQPKPDLCYEDGTLVRGPGDRGGLISGDLVVRIAPCHFAYEVTCQTVDPGPLGHQPENGQAPPGSLVIAGPPFRSSSLFLDSHDPGNCVPAVYPMRDLCGSSPPPQSPTVTSVELNAGARYRIHVSGTINPWGGLGPKKCGNPEPAVQYPSPGQAPVPGADDAQFRLALTRDFGQPCRRHAYPQKAPHFEINLGHGWFHPIAVNNPSHPSRDTRGEQHPYTFLVTGQGQPVEFRYADYQPSDNNGQFKITITPAGQR